MHAAVVGRAEAADVIIMAAAVADYTPAGGPAAQKIEKGGALALTLERTPDILADLGARRGERHVPLLIGFAAETGDPVVRATRKLRSKRLDLIVANDVAAPGSGFDVETNQVTVISAEGAESLPLMSKDEVAAVLLDRIEQRLADQPASVAAR